MYIFSIFTLQINTLLMISFMCQKYSLQRYIFCQQVHAYSQFVTTTCHRHMNQNEKNYSVLWTFMSTSKFYDIWPTLRHVGNMSTTPLWVQSCDPSIHSFLLEYNSRNSLFIHPKSTAGAVYYPYFWMLVESLLISINNCVPFCWPRDCFLAHISMSCLSMITVFKGIEISIQ